MKLEMANADEAHQISELLNLAYRGTQGWTTENDLVDGDRSTIQDVKIAIESSMFLTYKIEHNLIACICLEEKDNEVYIGSFAVHPAHQADGLGKYILNKAESYAMSKLTVTKFTMVVLSERTELISFYERRGYKKTGLCKEYPKHLNVGKPKQHDLTIQLLCKNV